VATLPINYPRHILRTLDSFLEKPTRVVLFGRAALALGFGDEGAKFGKTADVDAILPMVEMAEIESDTQFWKAIELTNNSLAPSGLYLSHLFTDRQVALTPSWFEKIVAIPSGDHKFLRLFRPSCLDLVLTKMMRNDREDLEDIQFILSQEKISPSALDKAFLEARVLEIPELQAIFVRMQPIVREMALELESGRPAGEKSESPGRSLDPDWWSKLTEQPGDKREIERDRGIEP
jgi:hypothetical protein